MHVTYLYLANIYCIAIAGRSSTIIFAHDSDHGGLLFIPRDTLQGTIPTWERENHFKSFLVGDNYRLETISWNNLSPSSPPPRNQLSRCFSLKKTCFKMTQNHTETKAGFKKVNHFECSFNWNAINNQHKPTCVFPIPTSKKYPLPVFFSGADWVRV